MAWVSYIFTHSKTLQTAVPSKKRPKVLYQCKREIYFKKGIDCVVCVLPIPLPMFCLWRFLDLAYHCETELVLGLWSAERELDG